MLAGFWPQPIQWIGVMLGTVSSLLALALGIYGIVFWVGESNFPGPLFGGVAVLFVLGIQGFILALVGEYLGRIYAEVKRRPLFLLKESSVGFPTAGRRGHLQDRRRRRTGPRRGRRPGTR